MFHQKPVLYRAREKDEGEKDEDIGEKFVEMLEEDIKKIHKEFDFSKKMIFTEEDKFAFEKATLCWIFQGEEITVILQENSAGRLTTFVIFNSKNQNLLPSPFIICLDMILVCL